MKHRVNQEPNRRAAVLAAVMLSLVVATMMVAAILQTAMITRARLRLHEQQHQVNALCESGERRARYRLAQDRSYEGEEWLAGANDGPVVLAGRVEISVIHQDDGRTDVSVVAQYPDGGDAGLRRTRHFTIAN